MKVPNNFTCSNRLLKDLNQLFIGSLHIYSGKTTNLQFKLLNVSNTSDEFFKLLALWKAVSQNKMNQI